MNDKQYKEKLKEWGRLTDKEKCKYNGFKGFLVNEINEYKAMEKMSQRWSHKQKGEQDE